MEVHLGARRDVFSAFNQFREESSGHLRKVRIAVVESDGLENFGDNGFVLVRRVDGELIAVILKSMTNISFSW